MEFTSFDKLRIVIEEFGANPVAANLDKKLLGKGLSVEGNTEQIVVGNTGIYYVDPRGVLTKVLIHIVDMNVNSGYVGGLRERIKRGIYEDDSVLEKLHRYHFLNCRTIERAELEGWRKHRYRMSRRADGYFFYRFVNNDKVLIERENQKLHVCKNCLVALERQTGKKYTIDNFELKEFLSSKFNTLFSEDDGGEYANDCAPNIYKRDWKDISKKYRSLKNYQCEEPGCPSSDLSNKAYRKYLHTHHISLDKGNNNYSNLKSLCIYCHASQPNHSHIRNLPDYKTYLKIRNI